MFNVNNFVSTWKNRGYEKGDTHTFWLQFLRDVLDISEPEKLIKFEVPVKLKHTSFIDAFFPDTKVIVEQKSLSEESFLQEFFRVGRIKPYFNINFFTARRKNCYGKNGNIRTTRHTFRSSGG
jgi:hypothetical protein